MWETFVFIEMFTVHSGIYYRHSYVFPCKKKKWHKNCMTLLACCRKMNGVAN